jgi:hypothetical protein
MSRQDDWLEEYLLCTSGHETPELYSRWVGIGLIASALKQNVWLDMNTFELYPNVFIVIVDSPSSGKSHVINNFGLKLLLKADELDYDGVPINIYDQKINSAALIKSMSELYKKKKENCAVVIAEELGFFTDMGGENTNLTKVLIRTYDNSNLGNETIARALESVPKAQLNIIGGTTADSLKRSISKEFLGSGALSRIIFVHSEEVGEPMPFPDPPEGNKQRFHRLAKKLNEFKNLKGEFTFGKNAAKWYADWYIRYFNGVQDKEDKKMTKRVAGKLLKLAMIFSVARSDSLSIEIPDLVSAVKMLNEVQNNYHFIDRNLMKNEFGDRTQKLYDEIRKSKKIKHSDLMRKTYHWMPKKELEDCIATLVDSDMITAEFLQTRGAKKKTKVYQVI